MAKTAYIVQVDMTATGDFNQVWSDPEVWYMLRDICKWYDINERNVYQGHWRKKEEKKKEVWVGENKYGVVYRIIKTPFYTKKNKPNQR